MDGDQDGGTVGGVAEPAFVRGDTLVDRVCISAVREADDDVSVFEPKARVNVGGDFVIGLEDVLDIYVDEVVERVDMLLD